MAKMDEIKEWLNFLNRLFSIGLITLLGIVGWLFLNYKTAGFILLIILLMLSKKIIINIKMLKEL